MRPISSLERYRAFVEIVERGSLTAAARHLGVSLQSVSRALTGLEGDLGVELVRRTTRRLQPTAAGLAFQARIKAALTEIERACAEIGRDSARIADTLRVGDARAVRPPIRRPGLRGVPRTAPGSPNRSGAVRRDGQSRR